MAILDRFRSHPALKHPDPDVRLTYVEGLSLDRRDEVAAAAREDESPRVRRAAVGKLMDPAVLALVARDDADPGVRSHAISMLRDIALEAFEETGEPESLAAVDALPDAKILSQVAQTATRESVARQALSRVNEARHLGSIARHGVLEPIRLAAFASLNERDEIIAVAMNSEFKDTAVAAVERLGERADLEHVAAGSNNKSAAKRARTILREQDERAAAEAAALEPPAPDPNELQRARELEARRLEEEQALAADERRRAEAAAAREREERRAAERDAAERVAADEARHEALRRRARLLDLVVEVESAAADADVKSATRRIGLVEREWKALTASAPADPDLAERCRVADGRVAARDAASKEADRRARRSALNHLQQLLGRVEPLAAAADLSVRAAERALRDVRTALARVPPLPSKQDHDEVTARLKATVSSLTPKLQELREIEGWQRWANVGIQEQLCEKMEALKAESDPEEIARRVRELQQQWRQSSDVPRAQGEALWKRFKAAHDEVWSRCESHFAADAERRAGNLATKIALCERAEALADSTKWIQTAEEIKGLQAQWKAVGPVSRGQEKAVWERFRVACDRFFKRRHEDLAQRKAVWTDNFAKKEALCVRAEAVADSTDWDAAANEIKRLQAEWKAIGPVKKSRSEAIWQRFRAACDRYFARFAQRHEIARGERVAAREAICAELEALSDATDAGAASATTEDEVLPKVRSIRARWQQELAQRGVEPARATELDQRFLAAFERVLVKWPHAFHGTDLDPDANRQRMETLVDRIEKLASSLAGPGGTDENLTPAARLAAMLKDALASNTIGGKVDEDTRWRAAQEDLRQAQASWSRIGPVPEPARRPLADRFQRACRRITEAGQTGQAGRAGGPGRPGR